MGHGCSGAGLQAVDVEHEPLGHPTKGLHSRQPLESAEHVRLVPLAHSVTPAFAQLFTQGSTSARSASLGMLASGGGE